MTKIDNTLMNGFFVMSKDGKEGKSTAFNKGAPRYLSISDEDFKENRLVKYIPDSRHIMIDSDDSELTCIIDDFISRNNLNCYSYISSPGHKHYWFEVDEYAQTLINKYKLNSARGASYSPLNESLDLRGYNTLTGSTSQVFLKSDGKVKGDRPTPLTLKQELSKPLSVVPLCFLLHKKLGYIAKSGKDWSGTVIKTIKNMKIGGLPKELTREMVKSFAEWHGDEHSDEEFEHKWQDAYSKATKGKMLSPKNIVLLRGNYWINTDGLWVNLSEKLDKDKTMIKETIGRWLKNGTDNALDTTDDEGKVKIAKNSQYFNYYIPQVIDEMDERTKIDRNILFYFTNGYIKWNWNVKDYEFVPTTNVPFTTMQIPYPYIHGKRNEHVDEYLMWMSGNNMDRIKSLYAMLGSLLSNKNDGVFGIIHSKMGESGKTQFVQLAYKIAKRNIHGLATSKMFGKNQNTNFLMANTQNKTGLIGDELPPQLGNHVSDFIKDLIDPAKIDRVVENKGKDPYMTSNNLSLVITTNRESNWQDDDGALKTRVVVVDVKSDIKNPFDKNRFETCIRENDDALTYVLSNAVGWYLTAVRSGSRADGFRFGLPDTYEYWLQTKENDEILNGYLETIYDEENDLTLKEFIETKPTFIPSDKLYRCYDKWFINVDNRRLNKNLLRTKLVNYLNVLESVEEVNPHARGTKIGDRRRGIIIKWK